MLASKFQSFTAKFVIQGLALMRRLSSYWYSKVNLLVLLLEERTLSQASYIGWTNLAIKPAANLAIITLYTVPKLFRRISVIVGLLYIDGWNPGKMKISILGCFSLNVW